MLTQEENPGVEFEYSIQAGTVKETPEGGEHYDWLLGDWSKCSAECGDSKKSRTVVCANEDTREIVSDSLCGNLLNKPLSEEKCETSACKPEWQTGPWSNCTAVQAGEEGGSGSGDSEAGSGQEDSGECPGFMFRNVYCQELGVGIVEASLCTEDKPVAFKRCDEGEDIGQEDADAPKVSLNVLT